MNKLNEDLKIISHLRKEGRITLKNISKNTKIPISTIYLRMKDLKHNAIKKYTAIVDFETVGYGLTAFILIKTKSERNNVKEHLEKHDNVNSLYEINNGWDYLIEAVFKNIKQIETFVQEIDEKFALKDKQVHYILSIIKKEEFLVYKEKKEDKKVAVCSHNS